jgi:hypothetical protein
MTQLIKILLEEKLITVEQLNDAKDKQMGDKKPIHETLCDMGFLDEKDLLKVLAKAFHFDLLDVANANVDVSVAKMISYKKAKECGIFPLRKE